MRYFRGIFILGLIVLLLCHWSKAWQLRQAAWPSGDLNVPTTQICSIRGLVSWVDQAHFKVARFEAACPSGRVLLSWFNPTVQVLVPGQVWEFRLKLSAPHGLQNLGGSDFVALLKSRGILATGSVQSGSVLRDFKPWAQPVDHVRFIIQQMILGAMLPSPERAMSLALSVGDRSEISKEDWQVFQNTGTNHLVAVGGLHLAILSGFLMVLIRFSWPLSFWLSYRMPAQKAAWIFGMGVAALYTALSGFELSAQRACLMLWAFGLSGLSNSHHSLFSRWLLALILVLAWDPWAATEAGFWLSFGSVFWLMYVLSGRARAGAWYWHFIKPQLILGLGLLPLTAYWFSQISFLSFPANLMAVPALSLVILPSLFLGLAFLKIFPGIGLFCLRIHGLSLHYLWLFLNKLSILPAAHMILQAPSLLALALSVVGLLCLLAPRGFPLSYLGLVLMIPLVWPRPILAPVFGEAWMSVIDVGQGLAVLVQTQTHNLLYDTGPAYPGGFDAGRDVILPFLHEIRVSKIDRLVISHGDLDHRGGALSVLKGEPVSEIETSAPNILPDFEKQPCAGGAHWTWDGVEFSYLDNGPERGPNNNSCVLKISTSRSSLLLPGDIEQPVEHYLLAHQKAALPAEILVAPHHGSKTSSSEYFIQVVQPQIVIFSTGFNNRFHLPSPQIVHRYQGLSIITVNTAEEGMFRMVF